MILMISRTDALQEYLLPQTDGLDHTIILRREIFGLKDDVALKLEITGGQWAVKSSSAYTIGENEVGRDRVPLIGGSILHFNTKRGESFNGIAIDSEVRFRIYKKYLISDQFMITIGGNDTCDISYNFMKFVSQKHGQIVREGGRWVIEDLSANGIFVNDHKISKRCKIEFGDEINIFGLKIVFLGGIIALGTHYGSITVKNLKEYSAPNISDKKQVITPASKKVFRRSPRSIPVIYSDTITIESPPEQKQLKKKPLLMQIGPSFTMAIPMLLGCSLAIYSTRLRGMSSGAFMYTGLITAFGSALFGSVWAIMNIRNDRREAAESEDKRIDAYGSYLIGISNDLRDKYAHNRDALLQMYPSAAECCTYTEYCPALWNRNRNHEDCLFYRLGLGSIPFQVKIDVPEERFSLVSDFLKEKPQLLKSQYLRLEQVPVGIDLKDCRLYGIVGGADKAGAYDIMYDIVAEIAAHNSYTDVKLVFVFDGSKEEEKKRWELFKWFPHVWSENRKTRFVASDINECRDIFYELAAVIRTRRENSSEHMPKKTSFCKPEYVMFVSDAALLENQLLAKYVYDPNPNNGLTTFILTDKYESLPNECEVIIENTESFHGIVHTMSSSDNRTEIVFDKVTAEQLEGFAKNITDLQVQEFESDSEIPGSLDFFEMYHKTSIESFHVLDQWYKNRTYNSIRALIGRKAGGVDCYLDLHEKYHGPHGLIAGTTGSGKSETLQTYILSLAMNYSPEDVSFFIIDFKGGGMANLFNDLPHMVGQISNLSGNQVRRAMISIKSENQRRQRIFSEYGVNNINLYTRLYKSREAKLPIPHLIIIIDEFAELKREEPDFMRELISVAQVGRSLGVHLILATQKPSGTVDDNIRSNSKFKLCLRVQDRQDSMDMLHKPDAAYITQAGRCYLQVGNDEIYELFQSGWSGAVYDKNMSEGSSNLAVMLTTTGKTAIVGSRAKIKSRERERIEWFNNIIKTVNYIYDQSEYENEIDKLSRAEYNELASSVSMVLAQQYGYGTSEAEVRAVEQFIGMMVHRGCTTGEEIEKTSRLMEGMGIKLPELKDKTQLEVLVKYLKKLAVENGFDNELKLWLPVLSDHLLYSSLDVSASECFDGSCWPQRKEREYELIAYVGLYDDPENQMQMPIEIDFASNGHLAITGTVVSGKSTLVQTLVYSLADRYSPDDVNFYILDYSSHMLSCFEKLPHCGGVIFENDQSRTSKFFTMLERLVKQRQHEFGGGNYAQYVKAFGNKFPALIVIIDNYTGFREKTSNVYDNTIMQLARDGVSCGIYLILTGAGYGMNDIPTRIADNFRNALCLEMGDKYKYMEVLKTGHLNVLPESDIKGRGLARVDDRILEFQTALSIDAPDDFSRGEQLSKWSEHLRDVWKGRTADQIPFIPEKPTYQDLLNVSGFEECTSSKHLLPVGYTESDASLECIDLSRIYCYSITGRARTGKTNLMKILIRSAMAKDGDVYIIEKAKSELKRFAEESQAGYISSDEELYRFMTEIKSPFVSRNKKKHELMDKGLEDSELFAKMSEEKPIFVFVADFAEFLTMIYDPSEGIGKMSGFAENIIEKGAVHNIYFFACMNPDNYTDMLLRPLYRLFTADRAGIHLGGAFDKQKLFAASNIPFAERSKTAPKGIAYTPCEDDENNVYKVIVPLA